MKLNNFYSHKKWFTPAEAMEVLRCTPKEFAAYLESCDITLVHRTLNKGTSDYVKRDEIERILRLGL